MLDRSQKPITQAVTEFTPPSCGFEQRNGRWLHLGPQRNIGLTRLELLFPGGRAVQNQLLQASTCLNLLLSGHSQITESQLLKKIDSWGLRFQTEVQNESHSLVFIFRPEVAQEALPFLLEQLQLGQFPEDRLNSYKQIQLASLARRQSTPSYWANRQVFESLYGKNSFLGTQADAVDFQSLNPEPLLDFRTQNIGYEKARILVSGQYDDDFLNLVHFLLEENIFNKLNNNYLRQKNTPEINIQNPAETSQTLPKSSQVSLVLARHLDNLAFNDRIALSLLNTVLGGYFGSRLMQDLRESKGLTYGIGSRISPALSGYTWSISSEMKAESKDLAKTAIQENMQALMKKAIPKEELNRAKAYFAGAFRAQFDGPFASAARAKQLWVRGQDEAELGQTLDTLWSCTSQTLLSLAEQYLQPQDYHLAQAGAL
ncbi:MAG: insulinase family protein [Bacteroidetes bacterium]|nr:insulinase family protein [Bacteroidota bacterium]